MNEELKDKFNKKKNSVLSKAKEKGEALLGWAIDNPIKAGVIFLILSRVGQSAMRERRHRWSSIDRECHEYDPSLGVYYDLRRPLTNKEKLELSRRHANGEAIGDILASFKVLY